MLTMDKNLLRAAMVSRQYGARRLEEVEKCGWLFEFYGVCVCMCVCVYVCVCVCE